MQSEAALLPEEDVDLICHIEAESEIRDSLSLKDDGWTETCSNLLQRLRCLFLSQQEQAFAVFASAALGQIRFTC